MNKHISILIAVLLSVMISCQGPGEKNEVDAGNTDSLWKVSASFFQPLPLLAENTENPVTENKVQLGKLLYYDKGLSFQKTQSCNTCHDLTKFGVDHEPTSRGDAGKRGTRNSPSTLNAALHFTQFWDGRMKDVEEQAGGPVLEDIEMAMPDKKVVVERLRKNPVYQKMFKAAFPEASDPVTFNNMQKAIGAFERTLITPGRFDLFLQGEKEKLDASELKGLKTFLEFNCTICHMGPLLGGSMFQRYPLFGKHIDYTGSAVDDPGRMDVTRNEADRYFFKVPSMRNITETWPYFHDGSVKDLDSTIKIMAKSQLNLEITDEQVTGMVSFLKTLTGEVPPDAMKIPVQL